MTKLQPDRLKALVRKVMYTLPGESDCDDCLDQMDQFVELELEGKNLAQAMPLVKNHLDHCDVCCEQYEALLEALQSIDSTET